MRAILVLGLLVATSSIASADALGPPPLDCAQGALGRTARIGTWCEPTRCGEPGATCPTQPYCPVHQWPCPTPEPWRCGDAPLALCVRTETVTEADRFGGGSVERTRQVALGPCGEGGACREGFACETARRCVHAPATAASAAPAPEPPAPVAIGTTPRAAERTVAPPAPTSVAEAPRAEPPATAAGGCACATRAPARSYGPALPLAGLALLALLWRSPPR